MSMQGYADWKASMEKAEQERHDSVEEALQKDTPPEVVQPDAVITPDEVVHPFPGNRDLENDLQYGVIDEATYTALKKQKEQQ